MELDQFLVTHHLFGQALFWPSQWRVEIVGHISVQFRPALHQIKIDDLADLHSSPDIGQRKFGRVFQHVPILGSRRHRWCFHIGIQSSPRRPTPSAFFTHASDQGVQHLNRSVVVKTVEVSGRAAVAHRCRGRRGLGELQSDTTNIGCWNSGNFLSPLRRMFGQVLFEFGNAAGGPVIDKVRILFVRSQNRIRHRQSNRTIGTWKRREPFITGAGGVGKSYIERHHFGSVVEATILNSVCERNVALVSLKRIGTKV